MFFLNCAAAAAICKSTNFKAAFSCSSSVSFSLSFAAIRSSIVFRSSSLTCLSFSACLSNSSTTPCCLTLAISAAFARSTFDLAAFTVSVTYSEVASITFPTVSTVLSKVSSTPVNVSINSLPAFFALSAAPSKSPLNTFTIASPRNL